MALKGNQMETGSPNGKLLRHFAGSNLRKDTLILKVAQMESAPNALEPISECPAGRISLRRGWPHVQKSKPNQKPIVFFVFYEQPKGCLGKTKDKTKKHNRP